MTKLTPRGVVVVGGTPVWEKASNLYIPSSFYSYLSELASAFGPVTFFAAIPPTIPDGVATSEPLASPMISVKRLRFMDAAPQLVRVSRTISDAWAISRAVQATKKVIHFFPAAGGPLGIAAMRAHATAYLTYHKSDWIAFTKQQVNKKLQARYWQWCEMLEAQLVDVIVSRSLPHLSRLGRTPARQELAQPILAIAPPSHGRPQKEARSGPLRVLYVGRLLREKGLSELLEAVELLRRSDSVPHFTLRLVGGCSAYTDTTEHRGPLPPWLSSKLDELNLHEVVEAIGHVDDPHELASHYAESDIFILPSWTEGFPRVIDEAASFSLPVVTTHVGGIPSVLTNEVDALLLPPRDPLRIETALRRLLLSKDDRDKLGVASFNSYRQRIRETAAAQHIRLLRGALENDRLKDDGKMR